MMDTTTLNLMDFTFKDSVQVCWAAAISVRERMFCSVVSCYAKFTVCVTPLQMVNLQGKEEKVVSMGN